MYKDSVLGTLGKLSGLGTHISNINNGGYLIMLVKNCLRLKGILVIIDSLPSSPISPPQTNQMIMNQMVTTVGGFEK